MVTGKVMAGAFFGNLADTMKENREYIKQRHSLLENYFLTSGFEKMKELNEARRLRGQRIDMAEGLGLSRDAAAVLETSGQLSLEVERLSD